QAIWYDNIRRAELRSGEMQALLARGVSGLTSNPAIFAKAIGGSSDYDDALRARAAEGLDPERIFEALAVEDIRGAADILRPVYEGTARADGYVSLEVSPQLAHDTAGTLEAASRLWRRVDRPNLMIKVPATPAGFPAMRALIAEGINVNATLLFALEAYRRTADAYLSGLEDRARAGGDLSRVASVASFFVSRVDTLVDRRLDEKAPGAGRDELKGRAAVANAKLAYEVFRDIFGGARFRALPGAQKQRMLWASTSTKNPAYRDVIYVEELIGPDTVNTVPPQTLEALEDHAVVRETLTDGLDEARAHLERLAAAGIDMDDVTATLLADGVEAFAVPFEELLGKIREKCAALHEA
ncbi:MAG: transaldolase, partial [Planctomycetes bacterium]|nr:transaldolase [Planctomycetota bacterium]